MRQWGCSALQEPNYFNINIELHEQWQWDLFLQTSLSPPICLTSHLNLSKGSLWFTVVSFFPLSYTRSKAGTHRVEMDSLVPKQRMWNFGAIWGGIFWSFRAGNTAQHKLEQGLLLIFHRTLFRREPHSVMSLQHSCFPKQNMAKATPEGNKNSREHEEEWGQAEQTCLRIEICFELSHDQALAHSCLLLRFLSTGETTAEPLWFLYVELFSTAAHTALHGARAWNSAWCFDSSASRAL